MWHYKTVVIPEHEEQQLDFISCDMCGVKLKTEHPGQSRFYQEEAKLEVTWGNYYPEGGTGMTLKLEFCKDCVAEKIVPWLKEQGVKAESTEWEY